MTIWLHRKVRELHESDVQRSRLVFRRCVFRNPEGSMTIYLVFLSLTRADQESKSIRQIQLPSKSFPIHNPLTLCESNFLSNAVRFCKKHCFLKGSYTSPICPAKSHVWTDHGSPIRDPQSCIMRPEASFINYVQSVKITQ